MVTPSTAEAEAAVPRRDESEVCTAAAEAIDPCREAVSA